MNWLLIFIPVTIALEFFWPDSQTLIFGSAALAIMPLAGWLGHATEHLAEKTGEGIGGLLNATFGNAAEMIIGLVALRKGLYPVVKASLTGSIIGNVLLVLGASILAGGLKHKIQKFNPVGARVQSTNLTLAAVAMVVPAAFHFLSTSTNSLVEHDLSVAISIVLLVTYGLSLYFTLVTHKQFFVGPAAAKENPAFVAGEKPASWTVGKSVAILAGATALIAWMSELLVGSVEQAAHHFGFSSIFVGVIIVAVVGNAAEHSTAVMVATKDRMDLVLGIAIGSSIQIALFVAPVMVFASRFIGPHRMDLVFTPPEVLAVVFSVSLAWQITADGESNWLEGAQLLAVYTILAMVFFFLPEPPNVQPTHP